MKTADKRAYGDLLRDELPRVVKTEAENERLLRRIEGLMQLGDSMSPAESDLLELLASLVERFEEDRYALPTAAPVDILRELMAAREMTQADVVPLFPSKGIASEVLSGKRGISKAQARKLGDYFNVAPAVFLAL